MQAARCFNISWHKFAKTRQDWIIEGTASFVENPASDATTAIRDPKDRSLREVNVAMEETRDGDDPAYEIQDFWVYLIRANGTTPRAALDPLFKRGATTQDVDDMLRANSAFPSGYDLEEAHWGWVRNQAFEATVTKGNGALNANCVFDPAAFEVSPERIEYDAGSRSDELTRSVGPIGDLRATVVEVQLENSSSETQLARVKASGSLDARVKLYRNVGSATTDCVNVSRPRPTEHELEVSLDPGQSRTVYALLSNSDIAGPVETFDVRVGSLESIGVERLKVSSADIVNKPLRIMRTLKIKPS
jgi:hypothetical protein